MSAVLALKNAGVLARKGEAAPALVKASFNDPSLAWGGGDEGAAPAVTWEDTPAAGLTPLAAPRLRAETVTEGTAVIRVGPRRPHPRQAFTARLPLHQHRRLKEESRRAGRPMVALVCEALEKFLNSD